MKQYEDPINFDVKQQCGDDILFYDGLSEIGQGSPVIGNLYINSRPVVGHRFGGPILCDEKYIYAPVFVKRFFTLGFKLGVINRISLNVQLIGKVRGLIFLNKKEGERIYFFEDISKTRLDFYDLKI